MGHQLTYGLPARRDHDLSDIWLVTPESVRRRSAAGCTRRYHGTGKRSKSAAPPNPALAPGKDLEKSAGHSADKNRSKGGLKYRRAGLPR